MISDPAVHTPPLSEDFPSLWDRYAKVIRIIWRIAFGLRLDDWQEDLLRHVLEVYPKTHPRAGELRYRQVLISLARQNGKTELAAILGLIGLLRKANALVIGIASTAEQARLVYKRTLQAIAANPSLRKRFKRLTDTRGIQSTNGALYEIKAAKGAALQGLPVSTGVIDEVHLLKAELWNALVSGMGARPNCIIVGITTAGDDTSELLKDLYKTGIAAAQGDPKLERFGCFIFEAPEAKVPEDDETLLEYLMAANPALACGRLDADIFLSDMRAKPRADLLRFHLNRFVESLSAFLPVSLWGAQQREAGTPFPRDVRPVFCIDRTPDWGYATITANVKDTTGIVHTEVVASIVKPSLEQLADICARLAKHSPKTFAMDGYSLKQLGEELKRRGLPVNVLTQGDAVNGASLFYGMVQKGKVKHSGDPLLTVQMPRTIRKNVGEGFRISRKDSSVEIDGVLATVGGVFVAETIPEDSLQLF